MKKEINGNGNITIKIMIEIAIVLAIMLIIKWIMDFINVIGAGSIAIWSGIIMATIFIKQRKLTWRELGLELPTGRKTWLKTIGLALVSAIVVIVFMAIALPLIVNVLGLETPPDASDRFAFFLGKPLVFSMYLVGVVWFGAALGEELLMRGYLLNRLADLFGKSKKGWTLALIIHAIIFGSLHIYQGFPGVIGSGVAALVFGIFYIAGKRRLLPVIIGHGLINSISLIAYYISNGTIT